MKKSGKPDPAQVAWKDEEPYFSFTEAMGDVMPMTPHGRILHPAPNLPPLPLHLYQYERAVMLAALEDPVRWDEDTEFESDASS